MKMSKRDMVFGLLLILPFVVTTCFLFILPDNIPVKYSVVESEWESKYRLYVKYIVYVMIGLAFCDGFVWRNCRRLGKLSDEREIVVAKNAVKNYTFLTIGYLIIINIMNLTDLYFTYQVIKTHSMEIVGITIRLYTIYCGAMIILLGNILPKMYDYKDPFSKKLKHASSGTMRKINWITGIIFTMAGIMVIVEALIVPWTHAYILALIILLVASIVATGGTYFYINKYEKNKEEVKSCRL